MSSHKVEVCKIDSVSQHPNADRLDVVTVKGWQCVTQRGTFVAGDLCVYIPIDSVLCKGTEDILFPPDSKVKLSKSRVKTAKIRGHVSQGMAVHPDVLGLLTAKAGDDVTAKLGIVKYEPPQKAVSTRGGKPVRKAFCNPYFQKYTDLENIKNYNTVFSDGEPVVITEKIHGTNFRAGWVPFVPRTRWDKLKHSVASFFGWEQSWEFVYGSHNLQLQDRAPDHKTFYDSNVYYQTVLAYELQRRIPVGFVVFGEVYGPDIQKGYHYGLKQGETKLALFDVQQYGGGDGRSVDDYAYLNSYSAALHLKQWGLPMVPELYAGPFSKNVVAQHTSGDSVLAPSQKVREGVVVKPLDEGVAACGRKILKSINADYLLSKHADEEVAHDQVA